MSSYLFIVKSELPLVIQSFLSKTESTGWVIKQCFAVIHSASWDVCFMLMFLICAAVLREWFLNGNYLILIVSALVILPLAVMRRLGMLVLFSCSSCTYHFHQSFLFSLVSCLALKWCGLPSAAINKCAAFLLLNLRLPRLHEWLLSHLHGVFPHFCESKRSTH